MSKKLLQVEHLSIALKNPYQDLVKDISFSLEEEGAVILLGQSGSGKTMTCRAILGLLNSSAFQEKLVLKWPNFLTCIKI